MAPVIAVLQQSSSFRPIVAVTGQHREMLDQVLQTFDIAADHDLAILEAGQSLTDVTCRALRGLDDIIERVDPNVVVVQGDTTTTFAGALAAFYSHVPVVHLEAGLRTGNARSPFPEELNRRLTTQLTSLHLAPTEGARQALLREAVDPTSIVVTGNTVIDALLWAVERTRCTHDEALAAIDTDPRPVLLVTAHRRESWGPGMVAIGEALRDLAKLEPDLLIVFPIHRNPRVREWILPAIDGLENVRVMEPLPYGDFVHLMNRSTLVLTDSGGIQEEAPSLGKPVLVMRDTTERPEAVTAGTARLVGADRAAIVTAVEHLLHDAVAFDAMAHAVNPYGDGRAADRTHAALCYWFADGPRPDDFRSVEHRAKR
jgi:UDP-N-acetylglucosamine 2-epimerase (non-hydrolysing)